MIVDDLPQIEIALIFNDFFDWNHKMIGRIYATYNCRMRCIFATLLKKLRAQGLTFIKYAAAQANRDPDRFH